jgi:hypothetical protein
MNVEPSVNPLILIFDLDETLFHVQEKQYQKARNPLSESATNILSKSTEGIKTKFPLVGQFPNVSRADKITAIAREKMKGIFQKIHDTNRLAESKGLIAPIIVKIMTTASYDEKYVKRLLDEFYFENDNPIRTGAFRIEYFNKDSLEGKVEVPSDKPTKTGTMDPRKARLIDKKFEEWAKYLPGLTKDNVVLIDNADVNIVAVESLGFKAIHYPTTPLDRLDTKSYTKDAPKAFEELDDRINKVAKAIAAHKQ